MKVSILVAVSLFCCVVSANAAYDYTIEDGYFEALSLDDYETLLMTGGGGFQLNLFDWSEATIEGTDPLIDEGTGGIWMLSIGGYSQLDFSGGEVHQFDIHSDSYAVFSGGSFDEIRSYQDSDVMKHITFVCDVDSVDLTGNLLTGDWLNSGGSFSITLKDQSGYDSVYSNINFVPEPATLVLFALGAALIRKRS